MKLNKVTLVIIGLLLAMQLSAEDFSLMSSKWSGGALKKTTSEVKNGNFSYRWDAFDKSYVVINRLGDNDWSSYTGLSLWVYSEEKTDADIVFAVYGPKPTDGNTPLSYYMYRITVDWEGWKEIKLAFKNFTAVRGSIGWSDISYVKILSNYGTSPVPGTILYFNDLKLVK